MGQFRVAVLVETSLGYGRGVLRGIVEYAKRHGPWAFYLSPGDLVQRVPKLLEWGASGIIARIWNSQVERAILNTGLPFIALDLSGEQRAAGSRLADACELCPDSLPAGRLAADHLLERGFRRFAFVGASGDPLWSSLRGEGFRQRIDEAGMACDFYPLPSSVPDRGWSKEQRLLARWLASLPRPLGVLACDDDRGRQVLEACRAAGLLVPEHVAVVGVDNDDLLCELSDPPLSSVVLDTRRGGYEAAALLDDLMSGRPAENHRILVRPLGVAARRSSDVFAFEDHEVSAALRFIHDNVARPLGVPEVVRHVATSRRTLELRFQGILGRSIHSEIIRCRLQHAQYLLLDSKQGIGEIAAQAGFGSSCQMYRVFQKHLGCSPSAWVRNTAAG